MTKKMFLTFVFFFGGGGGGGGAGVATNKLRGIKLIDYVQRGVDKTGDPTLEPSVGSGPRLVYDDPKVTRANPFRA